LLSYPFILKLVPLSSSILYSNQVDESAYNDRMSAMEKWVKELKNDLSKKVADVEVVRHDLDKVRNSLKRQDNKVHSFTSHIISLKTKWDDLIFVKASLEQRKSALSSEKAKMEVAIEKLGSESFWNGVLHVEHFCGV